MFLTHLYTWNKIKIIKLSMNLYTPAKNIVSTKKTTLTLLWSQETSIIYLENMQKKKEEKSSGTFITKSPQLTTILS